MSNEYNGKKRSELPDSVFGIPQERKYPMPDEKHTRSAIKLFNHVDPKYEEQLAKAVIKNMKKYGIDGSVVGPNNRLRKYLPEDMIKESTIIPPICSFETEPIHEYKPISGSGILSVIRPISQKDKNDIQHIMNNLDDFEDFMFKNICFYDIERHNQTPIGFVILRKRPELHTAFVSIGVTEEYRDSGIGSKLLEKAISYFKSTKDLIWLEYWVDVNNQASIALAEKSGFTKYLSNNTSRSLGYYKYHMKNDNNLYEQIQESSIEESSNNKIYHLSQINLDGKTIQPTVPSNYMTKNGYEDGKTKRVCFATSIDGCLRGLSLKCEGMKLFVHVPDGNYNIYKPSNKEVPDASITGEVWIKKAVKMKCIGQIYVIGDKGEDGIPYKYGDKTAELYDWEWKWIDKFNESYIEESSRSKYSPPYTSEEIKRVYGNKVYKRLSKDPAHKYRMDTGIELIHKEPTKEELERIWKNWNLMSDYQKRESDKKSIELFGVTNQDHYNELINSYTLMEGSTSLSPQNTGISTIIFDIGDVLVSANIKDYLIADPEIPNEIVDELLKLWFIDKDEVDDTMDLDTYREIINKRMGVEFSKYIPKLFRYNVECVTAFDYTIPMIQDLKDKGYKVYYLSNWSAWTYDLLQEAGKFDFLKLMDGGVFSYDVGYMKPNEEIYKILLNKYKINPEEAVFFDDREENIEAANKLGIHGIHFPRHDASIVYNNLYGRKLAKAIYEDMDNFRYDFDQSYNDKVLEDAHLSYMKEISLGVKVDEDKVAKEILNIIRPIIISQDNKSKASKMGLSLKCEIEEVDSGIVIILVLDGTQDKRDTNDARIMLKELASKCKPKLSNLVSKIDIGDGDEGCLYFTMDKGKIKKNRKDLIKESTNEETIQEELAKHSIAIENQHMVAKSSLNIIKPVIFNNDGYRKRAKDLNLKLRCDLLPVKGTTINIRVLDRYQICEDPGSAKQLLDDIKESCVTVANKLSGTFRYYVEEVTTDDKGCLNFHIKKMKVVSYNSDNEVMKEEDMEYPDFPVVLNIDSDITTVDIDKTLKESSIQEYGTTGGTIVGANQPDSVYIVNYMQNNVFSGYKEPKQAICKKGMNQMYTTKNGKAIPVDIDKFKEEASDISVFRFKETPILSFDKIIENASVDGDFYMLLTGDYPTNQHEIEYDNRFVQEENFFDKLDDITYCTESTIIGQIEATDYPYMKILTESMEGRCWNYYRDINGVFAMNELTGLRTPSYEDITDIPNSQIQLIERGTVYFGD